MKATMRNSRDGTAKHNDRDFDLTHERNDGHIDPTKQDLNVYWHCYHDQDEKLSFYEAEKRYYKEHYSKTVDKINERAKKARHKERQTSLNKMYEYYKTMPEETILQIGDKDEHPDLETFTACVLDYIEELKKYDAHIHILDWVIHGDEKTPHAHIRKVHDYEDKDGLLRISADKALQLEGFQAPEDGKITLINNRKISFDNHMRNKWYDICMEHGLEIEREPDENNITHYEKEENIKRQIEEQMRKLEEIKQQVEEQRILQQQLQEQNSILEQQYNERKVQQKKLKHEMDKDIKEYKKHVSEKHAKHFLKEQGVREHEDKTQTKN